MLNVCLIVFYRLCRSFVRTAAAQLQQRLEEADTAAAAQGQQASSSSSSGGNNTPLAQQLLQLQWALGQLVGSQPLLGPLLNVLQLRLTAVAQAAAAQGSTASPAVPGGATAAKWHTAQHAWQCKPTMPLPASCTWHTFAGATCAAAGMH
jgi:hypothetical protein